MSLTVKAHHSDFQSAPEGFHIARCYAVIDLGMQVNKVFNNTSPKVLIAWELSETLMADGRPFIQMQTYTASISERSRLKGLLEAWRGKGFTAEELQGFQLRSLLGVPCYLTMKHTPNPQSSQPWSTIISICKLPSAVACPAPINPPLYFDLDDCNEASYLALPEGLRKKINRGGHTSQPVPTSTPPAIPTVKAVSLEEEDDFPF